MNRVIELEQTRDKIDAELHFLRNQTQTSRPECNNKASIGGMLAREKTPEEIIDDLFTYHAPDELQQQNYTTIRDAAKHLALVIWKNCPYGADRTAAIRKLRETVMTANAAIALRGLNL